jgi:putative transposase
VEDLKIKNMIKSAKGTSETPGKMVKQKAGLNRVITQ